MFVVGILVILIGISWVAGSKILRKSAAAQTKAELKMLHAAVEAYKVRWGSYPTGTSTPASLNFVQYLSKVAPDSQYSGAKRPMFADFRASGMNLSTDTYDNTSSPDATTASDPYDQDYLYVLDGDTFYIYSIGLDGQDDNGSDDDIRSDQLNE